MGQSGQLCCASVAVLVLLGAPLQVRAALEKDYCAIGAGPAGLQMGFFWELKQRDYVILEQADGAGSFYQTYPRHRQLISINKLWTGHKADIPPRTAEYNLRHDWNSLVNDPAIGGKGLLMSNFSRDYLPHADDLVRYLRAFAHECLVRTIWQRYSNA